MQINRCPINRCPKCGRNPSFLIDEEDFVTIGAEIWCSDCGLHTRQYETPYEAVTKWNELTKDKNDETTKAK
jgi:Zn ribbon nucleic-acid-binding protein